MNITHPSHYYEPQDEAEVAECCHCGDTHVIDDCLIVDTSPGSQGIICDDCLKLTFLCFTPKHDELEAVILFETKFDQPPAQIHEAYGLKWIGPIPMECEK